MQLATAQTTGPTTGLLRHFVPRNDGHSRALMSPDESKRRAFGVSVSLDGANGNRATYGTEDGLLRHFVPRNDGPGRLPYVA